MLRFQSPPFNCYLAYNNDLLGSKYVAAGFQFLCVIILSAKPQRLAATISTRLRPLILKQRPPRKIARGVPKRLSTGGQAAAGEGPHRTREKATSVVVERERVYSDVFPNFSIHNEEEDQKNTQRREKNSKTQKKTEKF